MVILAVTFRTPKTIVFARKTLARRQKTPVFGPKTSVRRERMHV